MKKIIAALLVFTAIFTFSACNGSDEPEEVRQTYEGDGFSIETVTTTWRDKDRMGSIELKLLSGDKVTEYDVILPWLTEKEVHLANNQYLSALVLDEYKDGMVIIPRLETRGKETVHEFGIIMCNGSEIKDVTPLDSEGNHPVTRRAVFKSTANTAVSVVGYTDTDGDVELYELDFENMIILPLGHPE